MLNPKKQKSEEKSLSLSFSALICARDGNRTHTTITDNGILSPARLPIPPPEPGCKGFPFCPIKKATEVALERETRFELATSTLARLRSTN